MVVKGYNNAGEFLKDYEAVLLEREAVSQLILYNAYLKSYDREGAEGIFGSVLDEDKITLLFCNILPFYLSVYVIHPENIGPTSIVLADFISSNNIKINGIIARNEVCLNFLEEYKKITGCTFLEKLGLDIMEIRKVNEVNPVEGKQRLATSEDAKLIADWMIQFQMEALASETDYEAVLQRTMKFIEENKLYLYETSDQKVVSMACAERKLPHGMAITYVFTPEENRGKGYAAANVYYLSKALLEEGNEYCTIFVDKKNPLSCRAYEKVGYIIVEENYEYSVIPGEA